MKKQKALFMLFVMLMGIVTQFSSSILTIQAFAAENETEIIEEKQTSKTEEVTNYSTGKNIVDYDKDTNLLPVDSKGKKTILTLDRMEVKGTDGTYHELSEDRPLSRGETFYIHYRFKIPDEISSQIKEGDYFEFDLPKSDFMELKENANGDLINDANTQTYGRFEARKGGHVTLFFDDNTASGKGYKDVEGRLFFDMTLEAKTIEIPGGVEVAIPNVSNDSSSIIWVDGRYKNYIEKELVSTENDIPLWKIIINPSSHKINNLNLTDKTLYNSAIHGADTNAAESIEITEIKEAQVFMNGDIKEGSSLPINQPNVDISSGHLDIGLSTIDRPYVVYLKTPLLYSVSDLVTNEITLNGTRDSGANVSGFARASYTRFSGFDVISKKAGEYDEKNQIMNWEIIFNPNGLHIPQKDAKFTDTLKNGEYKEDSMTVDPNLSHHVEPTSNGFNFQFNEDVNEPVVIKYQVYVPDTKQKTTGNKVTSGEQTVDVSHKLPEGTVDPDPDPGNKDESTVTKKAYKSNGVPGAMWDIFINNEEKDLDWWEITDQLSISGDDTGYIEIDSFLLEDVTGNKHIVDPSEYDIEWNYKEPGVVSNRGTGFKLKYNKPTNHKFQISYKTVIKNGSKQSNSAFYKYSMKNEEKTDSATAEVGALVAAELKMSKSGHYIPQSNEVEWTVFVNEKSTNHMDLDNLFRDPMPDGQTYVEGSAKAYTGSGEYFRDDNSAKIEFKNNELRITNMEPTAGEKIVFRTKLDNPLAPYGKDGVHNTAYYQDFQQKEISASASLTVENAVNNFIRKSGKINENSPDLIDWKVDINPNGHHLSNVHIYDDSWENQIVQRESIKITNMFGHVLLEGPDKNTGDYVLDYTERQFHISMNHDVTEHLLLTYQGRVTYPSDVRPNEQLNITNDVRIKADYLFTTDKPISVTVEKQVPGSGGIIVGKKASLVVEKYDHQNKNDKLAGAEFSLYRGRKIDKNKLVDRAVTDSNGRAEFDDLSPDTYLLVETKAPNGYQISPELANGRELEVNGSVSTTAFEEVANSKDGTPVDPETFIDIPVEKKWKDVPNNTTTPEVRVRLFANNVEKDSMVLKESNNYRGVFTHLPEKENNNKINYEVREDKVEGYKTITSGNNNGWEVVNTYIPETKPDEEVVNHFVNKKWENDKEEYRPKEIEVQLYRYIGNEKETPYLDTVKLHKGNNWAHSFTELPKYKEGTKETYTYLAKEVGVPEGYEQKLIGDADYTTIVNSYVNQETELISKSGKKTWSGDNKDNRPTSLEIQLLQDGVVYRSMITTADKDWAYTFDNLPKDDGEGHEYSYRVKEANVPNGYTSTVNGMDITNTYIPPKEELIDHLVRKDWLNDKPSSRPAELEVQLYRYYKDGNEPSVDILDPVKLGPENGWQYTFKNLPKYEPVTNREYNYGAYEVNPPEGYKGESTGNASYTIIKNTYLGPELISKSGKKTWVGDEKDNRPTSLEIQLLQDNIVYRSTITTADKDWTYTFDNLPKDDGKGHEYSYRVKEANVPNGYTSEVNGMNITNTYTPPKEELIDHLVRKDWLNDKPYSRPSELEVQLYRYYRYSNEPSVDILDPVKLGPENGWQYTFKNLPKYEPVTNREYNYGAYELDPPEDYKGEATGNPSHTIIKNTYIGPELISKSGKKTWSGDEKNNRPTILEIQLLQDGKEYQKTSTSKDQDWEYTFENLPKDDGKGHVYEYKVKEANVPTGYESIVNGMNITNKVRTVDISGQKTWSDNNNAFNKRPNDIKVYLLQDGKRFKNSENEDVFAIVNQSTNWKYQFTDLPEYNFEEKAKYKYTVEEVSVPNYETVQNGYNINNIYQNTSKVQVTGQKTWDHGTNEIGKRPDAVTVQLLQNNIPMTNKKQTVTEENNWKYQFTDLQEFDDFGKKYVYTVKEVGMTVKGKDVSENYTTTVTGTDIHNTFDKPVKTSITGEKIWDDYNNKFNTRPTNIQVELMKKDNETNQVISTGKKQEVVANDKGYWTYTFTNLDKFDTNGKEVIYSVKEVKDSSLDKYDTSVNGNNIYNTYVNTDKVKVDVNKKWFDYNHKELGKAPEEKIKVTLKQDGKTDFDYKGDKVVELNSNNKWQHTFTDLPRYDNNGDLYEYTVIEEGITGYETDYDISVDKGNGNTAIVISNTEPKPETTIISGIKIWDDHNDVAKLRPGKVEIELLRNGQSFSEEKGKTKTTTETSAKDNWEYSFTDLLLKDEAGKKYEYTVVEHLASDSVYESTVEGTNITNKYHRFAKANVSVKKTWKHETNEASKRPTDIVVQLIRDEEVIDEVTLNEANKYEHTFKDLDVYDGVGVEYRYDVVEKVPEGYENQRHIESDGHNYVVTLTNTFVDKEYTAINGVKTWDDYNNSHNTRPNSVTIQLFANGKYLKSETIHGDATNPEAFWEYNFENLDKFDQNGVEITYTVKEVVFYDPKEVLPEQQKDYSAEIVNNESIINKYRDNKRINFSGHKSWEFDQHVLENRPEFLKISLIRDGLEVVETTLTNADTNWDYAFTNEGHGHPVYREDGSIYVYSLKEEAVDSEGNQVSGLEHYESNITSPIGDMTTDDTVEINISNSYVHTETTDVSGSKRWNDADNKFGIRPKELMVTLYANGEATEKVAILNEANNWSYSFTNLPVYDDKGEPITYHVEEPKEIPGYTQVQGGPDFINQADALDETTEIKGTKKWNDVDNKLGKRPEKVTIILYRNNVPVVVNKKILTATASEETNWEYEFKDLKKYDGKGNAYNYSVKEVPVRGYDSKVDDYDITNTYDNSEKIVVAGEKIWQGDQGNKLDTRPSYITVELYQLTKDQTEIANNQKPYQTKRVIPDNKGNWTYRFTDLDKYDDNLDEYQYVVREVKVLHYDPTIGKAPDYQITNTYKNDDVTKFTGKKEWQDNGNKLNTRPKDGITINLYQLTKGQTEITENQEIFATQVVKGSDTAETWEYEFKNLPKYDNNLDPFVYVAREEKIPGYETELTTINGKIITNIYQNIDTTSIKGEKKWVGDFDNKIKSRPTKIEVNLFQNGGENPYKTQTVKPDKKGNWTYEFKDLPKYDANLDEYIYTVTETKVPGYSTDYEEKESTINIINTYINDQTIDIPVMKKWQGDLDNHLNTRPDFITVELYQNDQLMENGTQNIKPDADGNWSYTYKDLPKYDQELNEYEYLVKEKPVSDYMTTVEQANKNEFVITNSFEGATTIDISGEKSWVDVDEANRPDSIKIQLQRSLDKEITEATSWENVGEVIEIKPDKKGNWEYTFVGQEIVDDKGNYYQYRVVEIGDDGKINTMITGKNDTVYQPTTTDWDIVNTQKQRKINIPVVKEWDEPNNNLRPESITITLYRDGVEVKKEIVTGDQKDNTWHHTFKDLDEFNPETMEKYVYTVKEDVVKHYDTTVIGDSSNGFTITNKSNPTTEVEVEGEKTWADSNDGFNKRPEKIKVHLLQDGQTFKEQEVVAPKWTYKFTGLPEYNPKTLTKYIYTVKEELPTDIMATDDQAGYLPNYLGHDINNEFQNTETTQVKGQKYWNHGTNALESRPTTVTIQLLQNGNPMVVGGKLNQVSVTEKDNWQYEFKDLPKFDEMGTAYIYTVEEIGVPSDYESTVSGMDVTNTFTKPVKTSVSGEKTWIDYQDKFNLRPEKITVNLMKEVKDGEGHILNEKVASQEVVGETWTYLFDDLFKYDEDGLEIKYSVEEVAVPEYETIIEGTNITNTYVNKETTKISVVKKWDDTDDKDKERPESIRVQLLVNGDYDLDDDGEVDQSVVLSDNNQWSHTFEELPKYDNNGEEIDYMVVEEGISDYITTYDINPATETREKQIIITNKKAKYQETAISGLKIWDDYGNAHNSRPDDITIKLLQDGKPMLDENGQEITTTINSSNNVDNNTWSYSFEGLPKHRDDGTAFVYTVEEVTVEHYTTKQKKNSTNITNTYRSDEMLKIKVQKTWDHSKNQLEKRPEAIKVYLKQDGKTIEETVLDETNNWQYDFKDVPKYDAQGVLYEYDVVEDVPNGYEHQRELIKAGNSYTVQMTNTFIENETTEIEGVKVWDDYDNKFNTRPSSVTIQLFADGKYQESQVISENPLTPESDWSYQFTNLDKYTTEGTLIEYTVKEVMLTTLVTPLIALNTEYTPEIVDNDYIINHYTNEQKVQFKGIKTWQYDQNVLENRPEKLVISLVRDGRLVVDTVMTSEEVNWQYSFTNNGEGYLVYRPDGTPYHYTIREEAIDSEGNVVQTLENYRPEIKVIGNTEVDEEVEINLTNSYNHTETTELKGSKTWLDANDKLGERPDKLRVTLYANDLATENTVEMTEETGWTYEFTELPVYDNKGDKISYRVEEEKVAGYEEIQGAPHFVNYLSKLDDKTSIKGVKKWNDQDDKLGNRPDEITVVLLRNGVPVVKNNKVVLAKVTAKSGWTYEFNDLPKYDSHANEYKYSVKEINVPNYVTTVDGTDLINTYHSSEVIEINGSKRWIDKDDKLGNRPSEIFVELYQTTADNPEITENQSPYRMTKVTEEDNWNYSFKELPKYDQNLDEYIYIVKEHKVANYNSKVDGYDITNIFDNSVTTEVNGKKIWKDNDDLFGVRPKSIQVDLYQNGGKTPMDTLEVTPGEDGDWNYSFKDLPKYDEDLNEYVYTVKEQDVSIFYESKVEGYDITNTYIDRAVVKRHVRKVWDDNDNQDNIRPDSIKVGLYQESKSTNKKSKKLYMEKVIVPNEQGVWETTFEHLPKYDEYNQEYVYTVVEDVVDKYDPTVVVAGGNAVITNHTKDGELTEVSGKKIWEDNNDQLGLRPDKIIVDLYQTASPKPREKQTPFATVEVTAEDNWEYFFTELPKYDEHGNECMYRVEERPVAKYDTIVEGYTIINKVNPYKPVDPEDPDPEKPVEPKDPEEPKKPEPLQPTTPSKENPTTNPKGSFLPKTGEATNGSWLGTLTGLTIISILGMVGYRRRKEDI